MQVYTLYTEELDDIYDIMINDNRLRLHNDYLFYTGDNIKEIEREYGVEFSDNPSPLFDIFMDEIKKELNFNYDMLDCREIFVNDLELLDEDVELFIDDFTNWLDEIRKIFYENIGWMLGHYKRSSIAYENMLRNVAMMLK